VDDYQTIDIGGTCVNKSCITWTLARDVTVRMRFAREQNIIHFGLDIVKNKAFISY